MADPSNLEVLGEKTLHQAAEAALMTYCPSMDLVALGTTDQQVLIYRMNGQRVYGATQKAGQLRVESIKWKPDGQLLAIAWSDGSVRLVGAESSKIVHQFTTGDQVSGITCMGWSSNLMRKTANAVSSQKRAESWEELLEQDAASNKSSLDLPQDLSLIDIETSLPKLSVLPSGGNSEDVFCSRSSLDSLFRPFDPKGNNSVYVMVVGTKEGSIHLSIYDSFVVGSFLSPLVIRGVPTHLAVHASHEQYSTHALLMKSSDLDGKLYFVPMDLRFISASSHYLSLLASRSTALQNLLRYIQQVQILMVAEWKATQELPSRFLRNINETLEEKNNSNIVQGLYHSVATGHTFPVVREWLVDELSERGHKRWDKTVTTGLESLRRLVHENMLPALERCSFILSRFAGIAKFQGPNETVGFSSQQISLIMDTVACLHLISSKILIQVVDELDLFASFSGWLRYEIDRLASDSSTSPNDDAAEKEASIDHSKVLLYLQTAMTSSPLAMYFGDSSPEDYDQGWNHVEQSIPIYDLLDKQLQKQEMGLPYIKPLSRVELLCKFLVRQASTIFGQIAESEKRNVLFGEAKEVGAPENNGPMDMRMSKMGGSVCQTHVAFVPKGFVHLVQVVRVVLKIENGISTVQSVESSTVQLGDGRIKNIKFLDNFVFLALWESEGTTNLLTIPYHTPETTDLSHLAEYQMEYSPHVQSDSSPHPAIFSNKEVVARFSKQRIPSEGSFAADKLEISERSGRKAGEDATRMVVLGKDKLHYKVLKLATQRFWKVEPTPDGDTAMS